MSDYLCNYCMEPRAYRAAEGGERACNCMAGEM